MVTAGYENTGVADFISNKEQEIFPKETITIDMFANTFFRNYAYSADDNILVLLNKDNMSANIKIFIVALINKTLSGKFSYGKQYRMGSFNNTKIQLPIKNNKIDFEFMENFIVELEIDCMSKLEAYLEASNLKEYALTSEEKRLLEDFESGKVEFGEFRIDELFEINSYEKRFDANKIIISEVGNPYVVRTSLNNGVRGYIDEDEQFLNEGNTISFGQDTATMFYQEKPYFTGDKLNHYGLKVHRFLLD